VKLDVQRCTLRFSSPLRTSYGDLEEREILIASLTDDDGVTGYGEAAPLPDYDGPDTATVLAALEDYRTVVADGGSLNGAQLLDSCRRIHDVPQALAAIDLALWDRAGRRAERPVAELLSDDPVARVSVNATITALDRAGAAEQAAQAVAEGFGCLKLKVGTADDAGRVAAVRASAGPEVSLRLDANGAWSVGEAIRSIEALSPAGLELVEEPAHGLIAIREVRERVAVRVAIDETAGEPGALGAGVADAVCLKISRCGGIAGLVAAATLVRASGAEAYIASTLDGPLGVAGALHAAAALASRGPVPPCGLATLRLFEGIEDPLPVRDGAIELPSAPGLGVEPI
jgi:L-alanine-DL-glutamate epimerase-like enolase superfamily enzyme